MRRFPPLTTQEVREIAEAEARSRAAALASASEKADADRAISAARPFVADIQELPKLAGSSHFEETLQRLEGTYASLDWNSFDKSKYRLFEPLGESIQLYRRWKSLSDAEIKLLHDAIDRGMVKDDVFRWGDRELTEQIRDVSRQAHDKERQFSKQFEELEQNYAQPRP